MLFRSSYNPFEQEDKVVKQAFFIAEESSPKFWLIIITK